MKRRLFSLFLALTLVVGMLPAPAFAQETEPTQVTEAPTEAPATEAPATEAPAAEPTPAPTEALAPETTVAPAPTEAPTEAPATEAPATEAPAAEPTPAPTEALAPETTVAPAPTEAPTEPAPTEDEAVAAVQAMIDALPDVEDMSESYLDALVAAYSAFDALSESQQAQITGVEKLEALFGWVNSQVSTLAEDVMGISGEKTWNNQTFNTPVKLTGNTTLTLTGTNRIECDQPLDLNGFDLTIQGTGSLELVGSNNGSRQTSGAIYDSTWTSTSSPGGGMVIESGTVIARDYVYNAVAVRYLYMDGGKLEAYGARSGIVTTQLQMTGGSLYATGSTRNGIDMWNPYYVSVNGLNILVSNEPDAQKADMEDGTTSQIEDSKKMTVAIGKFSTSPSISVQAQQGYLYEATAKTATFALSGRNVDLSALNLAWDGTYTGLVAEASADGKTVTVTTDKTVQAGTYGLKVSAGGASRTAVVTVSGPPICIYDRPVDTISTDPEAGAVNVTAYLTDGHTGFIDFQWKREDGTVMAGYTEETVRLYDLVEQEMLTQDASKSWLQTIRIYCTLSYDGYSLNTETVTVGLNSCKHEKVDHEGTCQQCGEPCSEEPLLVREDGYPTVVPDASAEGAAKVGGILVVGGTFYLTKDVIHRSLDATYTPAGDKDVILDLQGHTLESLDMGNFPYGSFTLKDGTLNQCVYSNAEGKLILDGVTFMAADATNNSSLDITVQRNTVFKEKVSFSVVEGVVHLRGGTFEKGIDTSNGAKPLALLDDGYAFQNDRAIVDASIPENLNGKTIQVVAHKCNYVNGKCECGRTCDHVDKVDDNGYCTFCHALVEPYAIGKDKYTSLEDALTAANAGDTITLRGDFYQGYKTVKINKNVTLNLDGYILTGNAEEPVLLVLAEDVTIQNGSVENTNSAKSSPAVMVGDLDAIGGLTTKNATFVGSCNGVTPRGSALIVRNGSQARVKSGTFTGGIYVEGSLFMFGGSATSLELGSSQGTVELSGGSFDSINPGNADYAALLAEGYAYQSGTSLVKLADMDSNTAVTAVQVVKCTHPDGLTADTACPYCDKTCGHKNINQTTGLCPECGYQMAASLTVDGNTTFFNTFPEAVTAANGKTGALLTLLKDVVKDNDDQLTFESGEITVNWNGHTLSSNSWSSVIALNGAELTLRDSSGKNAGGIANQKAGAIYVSGGSLTIESGTYASRVFISVNTASVKISDGAFKNDPSSSYTYAIDTGGSRYLAELMAPGYTLALDSKGTNLYDVYANKATPEHTTVYVVSHTSHNFDENGKCACGAAAPIQVDNGTDSSYFVDFESAVNKAKTLPGSTVRLRDNVTYSGDSGIYIEGGTFTIDWNGHTLSGSFWGNLLTITDSANVTLTDSSDTNAGGARQTGYGAAVSIAVGSGSVNIKGGTYSPNVTRAERCYGSVQISGGVFKNPRDHGRNCALENRIGTLSGMLADGTAFAYGEDGSGLLNAYEVTMSDNYTTVYAVAHNTHEFKENGVCNCGYVCPHEHWTDGVCDLCGGVCAHARYENGKCTTCGYVCPHENVTENGDGYTCRTCGLTMTVMVETADGNVSYTTDLAAALNDAEDGTTVTLLGDVSLENSAYIEDGKEVTLNLNGHNITRTRWQIILVEGNTDDRSKAKLVITGSGEIRFNVKADEGGQLDMSDWTGTVAWVDLENACDFVGPIGDGHLGELNISNWRSDNQGTILLQGGSIGKLWLNSFESFQMNLGSLLKAGCAAKSGSEFLPYDHAISNQDKIHDLTIEPCPHTGLDSSGRCTYCNTTGFVATVTKNGVTAGYTDFLSAFREICDGKRGILKLLTDVSENGQYVYRISGTLDLNGKNLAGKLVCAQGSNLQIVNSGSDRSGMGKLEVWNGAKVTIADTAGSIFFDMVTVESGSLADLLPEGGAYFRTDMRTWISAAEAATKQTLGSVVVREAPVKSVTLTANKTTVPYGESQTVTLTASSTQSEGVTPSYAWAEVKSDGTVQTFPEQVGTSFTLPAGVNAGKYTYRVSVTVGDYTLSKDIQITVTKAKGILENKDYPTEFTYGQTVPTPKAENFTTNNPDGAFDYYYWATEAGSILEADANPTSAGTYTLFVSWAEGTNHTAANLSLTVTIKKADQTADIAVVNETISGKGDGGVTLLPSAEGYEIREKGEETFEAITASQGETFHTLIPGVAYEIRLAGTKNYLPSDYQEVTVQPGRKLKVTLPDKQEGYTLTANKTQLDWHDSVTLTLTLETGYYRTASLAVKAGDRVFTEDKGTYTLTDVEENLVITLEGVEKDEKAPSLALRNWTFGQGVFQGMASPKDWKNISTATDPYFVISNRGNYFAVEASDGETGLASVSYLLSGTALTREALEQAAWEPVPEESLNQASPVREKMIQLDLGEWYFYVKAVDKAGNVSYVGSDKLIREENAPAFSGVTNGATYYTTQKVTITDDYALSRYLPPLSRYWKDISGTSYEVTLEGNREAAYTLKVEDACQNTGTITVYMKPISSLTEDIRDLTEDNVRKSDLDQLTQAENALKALDTTNATDEEKKEITEALDSIGTLKAVLEEVTRVEAKIAALPESVEPWDVETENRVLDVRSAYDAMTDHQKTMVDDSKLRALEGQLVDYRFTSGENQTWALGCGKDLRFTVNGQLAKVKEVRLNGQAVDTEKTAQAEGTDFALKAADLQGLKLGSYTLQVYFTDGQTPQTQFTVTVSPNYLDLSGYPEFGNDETVTVNGRIYPIGTDSGRYINLPETGDILQRFTYLGGTYSAAHENYPTGMTAYRIIRQEGGAKLEPIEGLDNLLIYSGCSIRLTGKQGIRMITGITQDNKKALTGKAGLAGYTLEEYGTLICWNTDLTSGDDFSLDMSCARHNYAYLKGKADPVFARQEGKMLYTNVLVGFGLEDCAKDLILRPYIKLKDMTTGETVTLYGGSVCRSIGYIAKQNENTYKPGTAGYKYIHEILNYTKTAEQGGKTK